MKGTRTLLCSSIMSAAILSAGSLSLAGCNRQPAPPPPPKAPMNEPEVAPDVEHRISYSGETLAVIAAWYTGRAANWQAIRDANPGLRPQRLNLGQVVIIPGDLVVQHEPMPKRFVTDNAAKVRSKGTESKPVEGDIGTDPYAEGAVPGTQTGIEKVPPEIVKDAPDPLPVEPDMGSRVPDVVKETPKPDPVPSIEKEPVAPVPPKDSTKEAPPAMDSEREKLLDELLAQ